MEREVLTLQPARRMNREEGRGEAASREEGARPPVRGSGGSFPCTPPGTGASLPLRQPFLI